MYDGKYFRLYDFLLGQGASTNQVTLTFGEIEGILHFKLPNSAYKYTAWWDNHTEANHSHSRSWVYAGWKKSNVELGHKVIFEKIQQ